MIHGAVGQLWRSQLWARLFVNDYGITVRSWIKSVYSLIRNIDYFIILIGFKENEYSASFQLMLSPCLLHSIVALLYLMRYLIFLLVTVSYTSLYSIKEHIVLLFFSQESVITEYVCSPASSCYRTFAKQVMLFV